MGDDGQREDPDRDAIVRRRSRLIAVALTGLVSGTTQACACLSPAYEPEDAGRDAGRDAGASSDAGATADAASADAATARDGSTDDASVSKDGGPLPCLAPLPPDAGPDSGA